MPRVKIDPGATDVRRNMPLNKLIDLLTTDDADIRANLGDCYLVSRETTIALIKLAAKHGYKSVNDVRKQFK